MTRTRASNVLMKRLDQLVEIHGGVRKAARVIQCDPSYITRLRNGQKINPSDKFLTKLRLRRVITESYEVKP